MANASVDPAAHPRNGIEEGWFRLVQNSDNLDERSRKIADCNSLDDAMQFADARNKSRTEADAVEFVIYASDGTAIYGPEGVISFH